MKPRLVLPLFLVGALAVAAREGTDRLAEASSGLEPEAGDQVFFPVDDYEIPWRENLKLTLVRPTKYPHNPVFQHGAIAAPDGFGALLYGSVIKENGIFRMWYTAAPRVDDRRPGDAARMEHYRPIAYAESVDGVNWTRPDLGLVEFRDSRHNNLVRIEPAQEPYAQPLDFISVLLDRTDPDPARRYKMVYITEDLPNRGPSPATAVSADGLRWQLVNTAMFTKGHFESSALVHFDGLYYLSGQVHPPFDGSLADGSAAGRVMKVFFSPDFSHWSSGRALAFYRSDYVPTVIHAGQEVHMGAGLWNRGNVILGFNGRWHGDTITAPSEPDKPLVNEALRGLKIDLGLVISNDAIHYREPVRNFVEVPHGAPDQWDSEAVLQANAFANTATQTLIWYSNWYTSRPNAIPRISETLSAVMEQKASGVGLLTLPRDRFGYFSKLQTGAPERSPAPGSPLAASCLTAVLHFAGAELLYANVDDVSPGAALNIALVDDAEQTLPGYTARLAVPGLKEPVAWAGGQTTLPSNRSFRILVTWPAGVDAAKLYALYAEHQ